ncbi:hypothetical protein LOAG_15082 [Loa loa]|uniref:Uncharacterized protein n=1 Tax=Loa loa TaxID=7209 RepID=A0A1S0TGK1_LOALO|nr:hypothetical protein LOAG_15082 [Loa loa]EFO13447.1 hypothetical protein LOAG_15082 [Loa loa]
MGLFYILIRKACKLIGKLDKKKDGRHISLKLTLWKHNLKNGSMSKKLVKDNTFFANYNIPKQSTLEYPGGELCLHKGRKPLIGYINYPMNYPYHQRKISDQKTRHCN